MFFINSHVPLFTWSFWLKELKIFCLRRINSYSLIKQPQSI